MVSDYVCDGELLPEERRHSRMLLQPKLRGVNLGGWMVLTPWLTPSLFYQFEDKPSEQTALDMHSFCRVLGPAEGNRQLREHWSKWVTDDDLAQLFVPPIDDALLQPIAARPEPNLRLCVMNVAMSSATAVAHERDGHRDLAAASRATSSRSAALCTALLERDMMAGLAEALRALYEAAAPRDDDLGELGEILGLSSDAAPSQVDEDWAAFLDKWRYGPDQRAAIRRTLYDNWAPVVRKEPE